ncbi:hypothetical protein V1478_014978 [Vespula squamosa]|uniref:Uncharacterized protein n=1 Tax=Vespula squamosa TaxID=30214 RepID=A0ABD2A6D6_VESSQ
MPFLQAVRKSGRKYNFGIVHSRSSDARDDNKVGPSNDFVDLWHSFALTFDECTSQPPRDAFPGSDNEGETQFGIVNSRSSGARDDNKVGPSNDFVDLWHSFALTFDECTSQPPRDAFPGSDNEGSELCTSGLRVRETTTKSVLRTTLSTSGTVLH